jgi:hypothetical protein
MGSEGFATILIVLVDFGRWRRDIRSNDWIAIVFLSILPIYGY